MTSQVGGVGFDPHDGLAPPYRVYSSTLLESSPVCYCFRQNAILVDALIQLVLKADAATVTVERQASIRNVLLLLGL